MATANAKMHFQIKMGSNSVAAMNLQAMTKPPIAPHFGNMVEFQNSRICLPQAWQMQTRLKVGDALPAAHTQQAARNASPTSTEDVAGLPSPLGGKLHLIKSLGVNWWLLETRAIDR